MNGRILVIDDQADNRKIMRDLLTHADYEVIEALTGEQGVAMAQSHVPDVILMDMDLPGIDGYEATRQIKGNPELHDIPIVAVTSYALIGDEAKAREAGCDVYFSKPTSTRALLAKVREYTG